MAREVESSSSSSSAQRPDGSSHDLVARQRKRKLRHRDKGKGKARDVSTGFTDVYNRKRDVPDIPLTSAELALGELLAHRQEREVGFAYKFQRKVEEIAPGEGNDGLHLDVGYYITTLAEIEYRMRSCSYEIARGCRASAKQVDQTARA